MSVHLKERSPQSANVTAHMDDRRMTNPLLCHGAFLGAVKMINRKKTEQQTRKLVCLHIKIQQYLVTIMRVETKHQPQNLQRPKLA